MVNRGDRRLDDGCASTRRGGRERRPRAWRRWGAAKLQFGGWGSKHALLQGRVGANAMNVRRRRREHQRRIPIAICQSMCELWHKAITRPLAPVYLMHMPATMTIDCDWVGRCISPSLNFFSRNRNRVTASRVRGNCRPDIEGCASVFFTQKKIVHLYK